jgi:hypothetical protein
VNRMRKRTNNSSLGGVVWAEIRVESLLDPRSKKMSFISIPEGNLGGKARSRGYPRTRSKITTLIKLPLSSR